MGKNLIQQRRGKGSPRYRAPDFRYKGRVSYARYTRENVNGKIIDLIDCPGHSGPLMQVRYQNGEESLIQAPEGIKVGDYVEIGDNAKLEPGNILPLKNIPEGTFIYNIEASPGDGGKFVRSSGGFAKIISKFKNSIVVQLPSNKKRDFIPDCRATVGIIAGSGRTEKPFLKAGTRYYAMKSKNKLWPIVSGTSMNAVAHPFGGSSSNRHKCSSSTSRHAPPGRKVGSLAPRRTGRRKR